MQVERETRLQPSVDLLRRSKNVFIPELQGKTEGNRRMCETRVRARALSFRRVLEVKRRADGRHDNAERACKEDNDYPRSYAPYAAGRAASVRT